jgi:hypothetical protein
MVMSFAFDAFGDSLGHVSQSDHLAEHSGVQGLFVVDGVSSAGMLDATTGSLGTGNHGDLVRIALPRPNRVRGGVQSRIPRVTAYLLCIVPLARVGVEKFGDEILALL